MAIVVTTIASVDIMAVQAAAIYKGKVCINFCGASLSSKITHCSKSDKDVGYRLYESLHIQVLLLWSSQ